MKDKNGIEIDCENCASVDYCKDSFSCEQCPCQNGAFLPSVEAYEARIKELQDELYALKASRAMGFAKNFAKCVGIDPLDCLKRNIAKLAGRKERGTLGGNGDER